MMMIIMMTTTTTNTTMIGVKKMAGYKMYKKLQPSKQKSLNPYKSFWIVVLTYSLKQMIIPGLTIYFMSERILLLH
jgi:hypothetical protein